MGKEKNKDGKGRAQAGSSSSGGAGGKQTENGKGKGKSQGSASASEPLKPATAINVRHILCAKLSRAEEALARVQAYGQAFDAVAREYSEDKARQAGSLGWKGRGSLLPEFEKVAYGLPVSTVSRPVVEMVRTGEGYHLVMVEGRR